jgi:TnpA family transposase
VVPLMDMFAETALASVVCPSSVFLARYLPDRDLQREAESGLNVVENYNGVNDYIRFGKRGELASGCKKEQEFGRLRLHILQFCLGYINTLMIQDAIPRMAGHSRRRRPTRPHPRLPRQHDLVRRDPAQPAHAPGPQDH